ncbi:hypothetical protein SAMN05216241_102173 [Limimonas halophila]|uniref:Uncharacterized protein n=1 Tax=Limimonas halophila TaxID=1082479 RepID=A0A1G7NHP8_9PROT|nr:ATP-binding protein [Limimonas halophila]SDF73447.1 hypothetical protein SAMN05216241_102173 [Limimonas halophila]
MTERPNSPGSALRRIADALERLAPAPRQQPSLADADAFVWDGDDQRLVPVERVNRLDMALLTGIDRQAEQLRANTERFARGLPANNALLWGARGMGKSSLVKAVHGHVVEQAGRDGFDRPALVEIHREDIPSLPRLLGELRQAGRTCILFCDDLSFEAGDTSYKSLKTVLEGGLEGRPANVLFYATSNRRHLMPRERGDMDGGDRINAGETGDETISLSDRFGLWLGFHGCDQATYLRMVEGYADHFALPVDRDTLHEEAKEWALTRGARNGRVAWQFIQDLAGRLGQSLG